MHWFSQRATDKLKSLIKCTCKMIFHVENAKPWPSWPNLYNTECPHCKTSLLLAKKGHYFNRASREDIRKAVG